MHVTGKGVVSELLHHAHACASILNMRAARTYIVHVYIMWFLFKKYIYYVTDSATFSNNCCWSQCSCRFLWNSSSWISLALLVKSDRPSLPPLPLCLLFQCYEWKKNNKFIPTLQISFYLWSTFIIIITKLLSGCPLHMHKNFRGKRISYYTSRVFTSRIWFRLIGGDTYFWAGRQSHIKAK